MTKKRKSKKSYSFWGSNIAFKSKNVFGEFYFLRGGVRAEANKNTGIPKDFGTGGNLAEKFLYKLMLRAIWPRSS